MPFSLTLLYHLLGIGSASGIFYQDDSIFIASDNAGYLYEFKISDKTLNKITLLDTDVREHIPKQQKPDFEALVKHGGEFYLFGSGSTHRRNLAMRYNLKTKAVSDIDLSDLYSRMRSIGGITADNFNIEGVFHTSGWWFFVQRGNGSGANNGIFKVKDLVSTSCEIEYFPIALPMLKHVRTSFTDAIFLDDTIWFLATAEDTASTYDDGQILGSIVGCIDVRTMELTQSQQISDSKKFEGIALYSRSASEISFLLCEDDDTDATASDIFKLTLQLD